MRHRYTCTTEVGGVYEGGQGLGRCRLVDFIGVWEFMVLECCLVENGRFAEGDI
jgi:hypothetical protein